MAMDSRTKQHQTERLWWTGHAPLQTKADALRFMQSVSIALRYNMTPSLPLAAMQRAAGDTRRSTELANALLAGGDVIETNVIADRLVLLHRGIVPAVFLLRRRHRSIKLSAQAERAFGLIQTEGHASSGDVRRFLGVYGMERPDPGDRALTELQREFLVDRGPSSIPRKGIPYLSPEGFPYRVFEKVNADVVRTASKLSVEKAAVALIDAYLKAAVFVTPRKLASMFRLLFSEIEMNRALEELVDMKAIEMTKNQIVVRSL